jgi:hypothetical protein
MNINYWKKWIKKAGVRCVKTMSQSALTLIGSDVVNIVNLNWEYILGACAMTGLLSLLTSLKGLPELNTDTESEEESE